MTSLPDLATRHAALLADAAAKDARIEALRMALHAIQHLPIPEQDNMLSANMRRIAEEALKEQSLADTTADWQPIDTSQRDGTDVRVLVEVTASWQTREPALLMDAGWKLDLSSAKALHWKPIEGRTNTA